MGTRDRIFVYLIGFGLGILLVAAILSRRADKEALTEDPWVSYNREVIEAGTAEPLPLKLPEVLQKGKILNFGYLPATSESPQERVWLLNFEDSYPYVRVVEDVSTGEVRYMAADQVVIQLKPEIDVTKLKPMLDELGLRVRMFNRKDYLAVVGVLSTNIDAVPVTIAALAPWADLYASVAPDFIRLQPNRSK